MKYSTLIKQLETELNEFRYEYKTVLNEMNQAKELYEHKQNRLLYLNNLIEQTELFLAVEKNDS